LQKEEDETLGWDSLVEASTKAGRMGAALPAGPVKQAFQQFIRLSGQMAGDEGAVDGATSTLYYLLTTQGMLQPNSLLAGKSCTCSFSTTKFH